MIKNYFRILKKPHAYLQTILKTPVKFQKDRTETVGGVKGTKYLLKTRNHAPRAMRHAPRKTKNSVPPLFFEKAGDKKKSTKEGRKISRLLMLLSFHGQLPTHIIHRWKLHFMAYKLVSLFSMRIVYTQSFEHLNKVGVRATMDSKLEEQKSVIKFLLLEG